MEGATVCWLWICPLFTTSLELVEAVVGAPIIKFPVIPDILINSVEPSVPPLKIWSAPVPAAPAFVVVWYVIELVEADPPIINGEVIDVVALNVVVNTDVDAVNVVAVTIFKKELPEELIFKNEGESTTAIIGFVTVTPVVILEPCPTVITPILFIGWKTVFKFELPEKIEPPLKVVALKAVTLICPVNVAPDKFAFVASWELIKVILAGVAKSVLTSDAPE